MTLSDTNILDNILNIGRSRQRAIYYRPDGTATLPLPADPYSKMYYLGKGFTLNPLQELKVQNSNPLLCPNCGFEAKTLFGLEVHKRKHSKKEVKT